jgi:hypothetical protein
MFGKKRIKMLENEVNKLHVEYRTLKHDIKKLKNDSNMYFYKSAPVIGVDLGPRSYPFEGTVTVSLRDIVQKLADHCGLKIKYNTGSAGKVVIEDGPGWCGDAALQPGGIVYKSSAPTEVKSGWNLFG